MDLILQIIHAYATVSDLSKVGDNVADLVYRWVNKWSRDKSGSAIEDQVALIATMTEQDIRKRDTKIFAKVPQSVISQPMREEMIGVLVNMTRNVRTQASGSLGRQRRQLLPERASA